MKLDAITLSALLMAFVWTMAFAGMKKHALELKRAHPLLARHDQMRRE